MSTIEWSAGDPTQRAQRRRRGVRWRTLTSAAEVADALVDLYERRGSEKYDGAVSQIEHALQCGSHAMVSQAPLTSIVAAFLHDVGHLLVDVEVRRAPRRDGAVRAPVSDLRHEEVGAQFLSAWFGESITEPIRLHEQATRYLCFLDPDDGDRLSPTSRRSLELQGGPFSHAEADRFAARPSSAAAVDLRRWDDLAHEVGAPVPALDTFRTLVESVVRVPPDRTDDSR